MGWLGVTGGVLILLLIMAISPFRLELSFKKQGDDDRLDLKFSLASIPLLQLQIPIVRQYWGMIWELLIETIGEEGALAGKQQITIRRPLQILKEAYDNLSPSFAKLLISFIPNLSNEGIIFMKKVYCQEWKWITRIGGPDPALTGLLTGFLWHFKESIYRRLIINTAGMPVSPVFSIIPDFQQPRLELEFHCIFAFRGGHIITTASRVWWLTIRSLVRG